MVRILFKCVLRQKYKHLYFLRHSYAVTALQNGDDVKSVQEALGHHAAAFTLDVYGAVSETMRNNSAERMEKFINSFTL